MGEKSAPVLDWRWMARKLHFGGFEEGKMATLYNCSTINPKGDS
jgi:hypothetical protein